MNRRKRQEPRKEIAGQGSSSRSGCETIRRKMPTPIPKLIVFDLDYTLWPFWLDTHVDPPFTKKSDGNIYDRSGYKIKVYPDVPGILERLLSRGITLGVASRTSEIDSANQLVHLLGWEKYFQYKEIYPGDKKAHFQKFAQQSGLPFSDMIFFDDESRNICAVSTLGVTCILAEDGMSNSVLQEGLDQFVKNRRT